MGHSIDRCITVQLSAQNRWTSNILIRACCNSQYPPRNLQTFQTGSSIYECCQGRMSDGKAGLNSTATETPDQDKIPLRLRLRIMFAIVLKSPHALRLRLWLPIRISSHCDYDWDSRTELGPTETATETPDQDYISLRLRLPIRIRSHCDYDWDSRTELSPTATATETPNQGLVSLRLRLPIRTKSYLLACSQGLKLRLPIRIALGLNIIGKKKKVLSSSV